MNGTVIAYHDHNERAKPTGCSTVWRPAPPCWWYPTRACDHQRSRTGDPEGADLPASLSRMKIDNMREEHHERVIQEAEKLAAQEKRQKPQEKKRTGFIVVSIGEGMNEIFREIGVDYIIEGGQTMNPSTDDMLQAIDEVNAETIFILPNNKNIILAAQQAEARGR